MPVISVVVPRLKTNQLRWTFSGAFEVGTTVSDLIYEPALSKICFPKICYVVIHTTESNQTPRVLSLPILVS